MKKYFLFMIATIVFSCDECEMESIFDDIGFYGIGTALINGSSWKGKTGVFKSKVYCEPDTCISLLILHYNSNMELRSKILVDQIPLTTGIFAFNKIEPPYADTTYRLTYSEYAEDGDVITGYYKLAYADPEFYIDIKELNKVTGDIRGNFKAKVVRDTAFIGPLPDTINIENGEFFGKINWK